MNKSTMMMRRLVSAPYALRSAVLHQQRSLFPQFRSYASQSVTQASFWANLIPKPFRKSEQAVSKKQKSKEWNPATFFICIFLLVGSMPIQMIALRNEYAAFSRRADAKIGVLNEIIQKVRNGEKPDVEALLGVGDPEQEREWEEVLQAIEREDAAFKNSTPENSKPKDAEIARIPEQPKTKSKSNGPAGFY